MTARMSSRVNVKYKTKYRVRNWSEYDNALRKRGDVTVWFDEDAIEQWTPANNGRRGAQRRYSNVAILTALTFRVLFRLPFRQSEGFLNSILGLMGLDLKAPDHTTLSRRNRDVEVPRLTRKHEGPLHIIVDSTGLKIRGDGEWHSHKHKTKARRQWRKLHVGVDDQGFIVARELTENGVADSSAVPELLEQIDEELERFTGDGGYDTSGVYDAANGHQDGPVTVVIPPRKTARACPPKTLADVQRNESIEGIARLGRREWKKRSGYHQQGRAENTFYRYKRILGGDMLAIDFDSQQREAQIGCNILNRMSALGMPSSFRIG